MKQRQAQVVPKDLGCQFTFTKSFKERIIEQSDMSQPITAKQGFVE